MPRRERLRGGAGGREIGSGMVAIRVEERDEIEGAREGGRETRLQAKKRGGVTEKEKKKKDEEETSVRLQTK